MANYTSQLKTWGSSGAEFPSGYSYEEGEQPVDAWDNYVTFNVIDDLINQLIPLTNSRIETDKGAAGSQPASPEDAHYYYDKDNETPEYWDSTVGSWQQFATSSDTLTIDAGNGLLGGGSISPTGGSINIDTDGADIAGDGLKDAGSGRVRIEPSAFAGSGLQDDGLDNLELVVDSISANAGDGLKGGGSTSLGSSFTFNIEPSDFAGSGLRDDGADNLELSADSVTVGGNAVSLGGSTGIALGDLSNVSASGEGHGNGFNADTVDGANVYVQSSAPSNPQTGDVWIDTS